MFAAIRPEGFKPDGGPLVCGLERIEVMGRDVSIVSKNPAFIGETGLIRSIVDADNVRSLDMGEVRFSLKPHKVFVFDKKTQERIRFEVRNG